LFWIVAVVLGALWMIVGLAILFARRRFHLFVQRRYAKGIGDREPLVGEAAPPLWFITVIGGVVTGMGATALVLAANACE
jgi:uncharacterized membrane-anchored protein YitT (DUF2179 family)